MNINKVEEFEKLVKDEFAPEFDAKSLLNKLNVAKNKKSTKFANRRAVLVCIILTLLFSSLVFGEELIMLTKTFYGIQDKEGKTIFSLFSNEDTKSNESLNNEANSKKIPHSLEKEIMETLSPGYKAYVMHNNTENPSLKILSKALTIESEKELERLFSTQFLTLNYEEFKFEYADVYYSYGKDSEEAYNNFMQASEILEEELAVSNKQVAYYIPEPELDYFDRIQIHYKKQEKDDYKYLDLYIYSVVGSVESKDFETDNIEKIIVNDEEILYNTTKRDLYYIKDDLLYYLVLPYKFSNDEVVELIESLS